MQKVQLTSHEMEQGQALFIGAFIRAAIAQGFAIEWIEAVVTPAIANHCTDFWPIMLAHIKIIPPQPDRSQPHHLYACPH